MVALVEKIARIYPDFQECTVTTAAVTSQWNNISPSVRPGVIQNNLKHVLTDEGLYVLDAFQPVFLLPNGNKYEPYYSAGNLVVVKQTNPDIYKFIAAYCHLMGYGSEHEALSLADKKARMIDRRIYLQCGNTSEVMVSLLQDQGIPARRIHLLGNFTATTGNGRDEGHVCIEVMIGGQWRFVDPSRDIYFTVGGVHVSALALRDAGIANANVVRLAPTEFTPGADYVAPVVVTTGPPVVRKCFPQNRTYIDMVMGSEAANRTWEQGIFYSYGWAHPSNGEIWFLNEGQSTAHKTWLTGLSSAYKLKTRAQILSQFY